MIAHVDGNPEVERQGEYLLLSFPSGGEKIKLMLSRNGGMYLMGSLSLETTAMFTEQGASVVPFRQKGRRPRK